MQIRVVPILLLLIGALSGLTAEAQSEPVTVAGLPPRPVRAAVLSKGWEPNGNLGIEIREQSGSVMEVHISGLVPSELPIGQTVSLEADTAVSPAGVRRMIRFVGTNHRILGVIALRQGSGSRVLDSYTLRPGRPLGRSRANGRVEAGVVLIPDRGAPVSIVPGGSVFLEVEGSRWKFTCRSASVSIDTSKRPVGTSTPSSPSRIPPQPVLSSEAPPFLVDYTLFPAGTG